MESLFRVDWVPAEVGGSLGEWAVVGDCEALVGRRFADLGALAASGFMPAVVVLPVAGGAVGAHDEVGRRAPTIHSRNTTADTAKCNMHVTAEVTDATATNDGGPTACTAAGSAPGP
ncbi:hypothetical protein VM98_35140, partial [Streptomyces rubellomurinus subsp. indigoferus]